MTLGQPEGLWGYWCDTGAAHGHWDNQMDTGAARGTLGWLVGHWGYWCGTGPARGALLQQGLEHKAVLLGVYRHTGLLFLGYWQRILEISNNNAACFHVRVKNCMDGALTDQICARSVSKAHIPVTARL